MTLKTQHLSGLLLMAGLLALVLAGCASLRPKPAGLSDEQVSVLAEDLLQAIDAGDYAAFTRDFSDPMKTAFPESEFNKLRDLLASASGEFLSIDGAPSLANNGDYAVYSLPARYAKEQVVTTLTFKIGDDKVEGLFFSSPNIKKATQ